VKSSKGFEQMIWKVIAVPLALYLIHFRHTVRLPIGDKSVNCDIPNTILHATFRVVRQAHSSSCGPSGELRSPTPAWCRRRT